MQAPLNLLNTTIWPLPFNQVVDLKTRKISTDQAESAMKTLCDYICLYTGMELSQNEQAELRQVFRCRTVERRQYLLQEGDICRYTYFVLSGALRMFSVNEKGYEAIVALKTEHTWITDRESIDLQRPSCYNIEALENSQVLQIAAAHLEVLSSCIPAIRSMNQRQHTENAIITQQRIYAAISMSAEDRYNDLLAHNPEFVRRFSQVAIASYLGIKAETLSRLRKR